MSIALSFDGKGRFRRPPIVLAFLAFFLAGSSAVARSEAVSPPRWRAVSEVLRFFTWRASGPATILKAIEEYESGRLFGALAAAEEGLEAPGLERFHDEAYLVRALALAELGWREEAARSFAAVLESKRVSPYYPLALLGLVEAYHAEGRSDAVAEAYGRYFETPWKGSDRRSSRIRNLFLTYGELRTSRRRAEEEELLRAPSRLAEKLRERKERPSERLSYLAGLDLFRIGRYSASLRALKRISILSFYYPYTLYTSAQAEHALGREKQARAKVEALLSFPPAILEESVLIERAGLLRAQLAFESGSLDGALSAAGKVAGSGVYALQARLFRAGICLAVDQPGLAAAYYRDVGGTSAGAQLQAERALGSAAAYSALGDFHTAVVSLQAAAEVVAGERAALESSDLDHHAETLRTIAEEETAEARAASERRRRRLAAGIRRVLDFKGPLNLGKVARIVFTSHRNTVIGEPVYDLRLLAEADEGLPLESRSDEGDRIDYLRSPLRPGIEAALWSLPAGRKSEEESPTEELLRLLDAAMKWLEGRFPRADGVDSHEVAAAAAALSPVFRNGSDGAASTAAFDLEAPLAPQISAARARIIAEARVHPGSNDGVIDGAALAAARETTSRAVRESVTLGIRKILQQRSNRLRLLEYDLESALSQAMAEEKARISWQERSNSE